MECRPWARPTTLATPSVQVHRSQPGGAPFTGQFAQHTGFTGQFVTAQAGGRWGTGHNGTHRTRATAPAPQLTAPHTHTQGQSTAKAHSLACSRTCARYHYHSRTFRTALTRTPAHDTPRYSARTSRRMFRPVGVTSQAEPARTGVRQAMPGAAAAQPHRLHRREAGHEAARPPAYCPHGARAPRMPGPPDARAPRRWARTG